MTTTITTTPEITTVINVTEQGPSGAIELAAHLAAADPHPQYATTAEASAAAPVQSVAGKVGAVTLAKADVGLSNVDNTSDANKPISDAQANVNAKTLQKNANNRYVVDGTDDGTNPLQVSQIGLKNAATLSEHAIRKNEFDTAQAADALAIRNATQNLIDANWQVGVMPAGWTMVGTSGENSIVIDSDPSGVLRPVWQAGVTGDIASGEDGGFGGSPTIPIDTTQIYEFRCFVKRVGVKSGLIYGGLRNSDGCVLNTTTNLATVYAVTGTTLGEVGQWLLMRGYIFPAGSTGYTHAGAGLYDAQTGKQLLQGNNVCWKAGVTSASIFGFLFNAIDPSAGAVFIPPELRRLSRRELEIPDVTQYGAIVRFVTKTSAYTAVHTDEILADTSVTGFTITLPVSPTTGDWVEILDSKGTFATGGKNLTVSGNGKNIKGAASLVMNVNDQRLKFVYNGTEWRTC